jgi:hypothetical protein
MEMAGLTGVARALARPGPPPMDQPALTFQPDLHGWSIAHGVVVEPEMLVDRPQNGELVSVA